MDDPELKGSCLCGAIRYRVRGPWLRFWHCHCSRCRKVTGSAHATNLFAEAGNFQWTAGEGEAVRYNLPGAARFGNTFCRHCGSRVPHLSRDGKAYLIPAGSLDDAPDIQPRARIFWDSRAPWSCDGDGLPRFEAGPPAGR
jgi:hypothetical protein